MFISYTREFTKRVRRYWDFKASRFRVQISMDKKQIFFFRLECLDCYCSVRVLRPTPSHSRYVYGLPLHTPGTFTAYPFTLQVRLHPTPSHSRYVYSLPLHTPGTLTAYPFTLQVRSSLPLHTPGTLTAYPFTPQVPQATCVN